jgi:hypothetical protein
MRGISETKSHERTMQKLIERAGVSNSDAVLRAAGQLGRLL